jgi:uncharacterized protein (DUF1800 family)
MADRQAPPTAPLVDLIFPNRDQHRDEANGAHTATTTGTRDLGSVQWLGELPRTRIQPPKTRSQEKAEAAAHRRAGRLAAVTRLFSRKTKVIQVASGRSVRRNSLAMLPVRRRRLLLGLGTGAAVAGGAGTAAALLTGGLSFTHSSGRRPDTAVEGLGAAGLASSPAAAAKIAAQATPTWPTPLSRDPELHLLRRATFGPTLVDVVAIKQMGIDAWLERQFNPAAIPDPAADTIVATYPTTAMSTAQLRATLKDGDSKAMAELGRATLARQLWSSRQLFEVMVDFWSNHLNVTNPFDGGWDVRTPYDNDVIRANALGRFGDMMWNSARHPAMMRYLDNARSQKRSVNENYGRELLELHTVGLDAKYTEVDVRQSAYILTGRTVDNNSNFFYNSGIHYTGAVKVLDFGSPNPTGQAGLALGDEYVGYLVGHPSTAKRIAFKLARRFVCDDPPQTLVDRLTQSYLDNGSAIVPMLRTLFSSVEFWMSTGLKVRRPLENVVAAARIIGVTPGAKTADGVDYLYGLATNLGQAPLAWGPPDGYADYAEAWGSAHATLGNWNAHRALLSGAAKGLTFPTTESFVGLQPATVGEYLDTVSLRLVHQPMMAEHKTALLAFLGSTADTAVKDLRLGGKIDTLAPLILDSVYHALR